MQNISIWLGNHYLSKREGRRMSLIINIILSPLSFLSNLYIAEQPSTINCFIGKESSILVLNILSMSITQ